MSENYGNDHEKMLDWDKNLGGQSEYVKKAIEPLMTWNWAYTKECMDIGNYQGNADYEQFWKTKNEEDPNFVKEYILKEFGVGDLYDKLGYEDEPLITVKKLKSLGIEGERHRDKVDHVFDDNYLKSIDRENPENYFKEESMSEKFNWENANLVFSPHKDDYSNCDYLKTSFGISNSENNPYYFLVDYSDSYKVGISFFRDQVDVCEFKSTFDFKIIGDINTAKKLVENTVEQISNLTPFHNDLTVNDIKNNLRYQIGIDMLDEFNERTPSPDRRLETAQKHGEEMDDYDPEYNEHLEALKLQKEAEYTNKRLGSFPQDEWIKTHPEFRKCIIHTFKNSDPPARVLFGLKGGAYSTIDVLNGHNADPLIEYERNDSSTWFSDVSLDVPNHEEKAKIVVENAIKHLDKIENLNIKDIYKYLNSQCRQLEKNPEQTITSEQSSAPGRQLETAQKTGYVQGVCESVLAFNTDENRKIMSESAMVFLSKKLLSEMNVTKDMARKFAKPETFKALEQSVFKPKQEQQLEHTQSVERKGTTW